MTIIKTNRPTPIHWLRTGMMQSRRVGRIKLDSAIGSAFYVDGGDFDAQLKGIPLLITTHHNIGDNDEWKTATVTFDGMIDDPAASPICGIRRMFWSSPVDALDTAIMVLDNIPGYVDEFAVAPSSPKPNDLVYIFGYPLGGGMMFSQLDNSVLGEEDKEILYQAPTQPGSSGSPVFNDHWEVVAMHRSGMRHGVLPAANRGIKMNLIVDAVRNAMPSITVEPQDKIAPRLRAVQVPAPLPEIQEIQYFSVFISYSQNDKLFARRLLNNLQNHGIRCWLDEHQIYPGDDIYDRVQSGIRLWDKVLLCCSKASLTSWWVDNELDQAFQKEQLLMKERGHKVLAVIPLDLDGFLFGDWQSGKAPQLRTRLAADFKNWQTDADSYQKSLERLIVALRADPSARESPPQSLL